MDQNFQFIFVCQDTRTRHARHVTSYCAGRIVASPTIPLAIRDGKIRGVATLVTSRNGDGLDATDIFPVPVSVYVYANVRSSGHTRAHARACACMHTRCEVAKEGRRARRAHCRLLSPLNGRARIPLCSFTRRSR